MCECIEQWWAQMGPIELDYTCIPACMRKFSILYKRIYVKKCHKKGTVLLQANASAMQQCGAHLDLLFFSAAPLIILSFNLYSPLD